MFDAQGHAVDIPKSITHNSLSLNVPIHDPHQAINFTLPFYQIDVAQLTSLKTRLQNALEAQNDEAELDQLVLLVSVLLSKALRLGDRLLKHRLTSLATTWMEERSSCPVAGTGRLPMSLTKYNLLRVVEDLEDELESEAVAVDLESKLMLRQRVERAVLVPVEPSLGNMITKVTKTAHGESIDKQPKRRQRRHDSSFTSSFRTNTSMSTGKPSHARHTSASTPSSTYASTHSRTSRRATPQRRQVQDRLARSRLYGNTWSKVNQGINQVNVE